MSPRLFLLRVVEPGLQLLPGYMVSDAARVMLMAIAGQETNWSARIQANDGPARGYWQFEPGGVAAVLNDPRAAPIVATAAATMDLAGFPAYTVIQYNDQMACVFARLLLWSDAAPLPAIGDANGSWNYYSRCWRPGKPDDTRWGPAYSMACSTVSAK